MKNYYLVYREWGYGMNVLGVTDPIDASVELIRTECTQMGYEFEEDGDDSWSLTDPEDDVIYNCIGKNGAIMSHCIICPIDINQYLGISAED